MARFATVAVPCARIRTARRRWRAGAALLAIAAMLGSHSAAFAQSVRVFEYTPPLEVLRSILVPESAGGATRRIVIPQRDDAGAAKPVQPAAAPRLEPVANDAAAAGTISSLPPAPPAVTPAVASVPAPGASSLRPREAVSRPAVQPAAVSMPSAQDQAAGIVGFRINFALNSAIIPASADPFLDRLAELLQQEKQVALVVEGHTDAYGSDEYNLQLSELRAEAVGLALVHRGVAADRLSVVGKGKTEPLSSDPYDPHNRRVQFVRADGAAK